MARLYLLIDGYNLLHAVGSTKNRRAGDTERNRHQLLHSLTQRLNPVLHSDTTVVFDGIEDENRPQSRSYGAITVRFAGTGSDADSEIERLLAGHSSPKQVLIVSSDHRLHKAAARKKATCIDSEDFLRQFDEPEPLRAIRRKRAHPAKIAATKPLTGQLRFTTPPEKTFQDSEQAKANEADDYLEDFLMIDVSDIKRSVRKEKF